MLMQCSVVRRTTLQRTAGWNITQTTLCQAQRSVSAVTWPLRRGQSPVWPTTHGPFRRRRLPTARPHKPPRSVRINYLLYKQVHRGKPYLYVRQLITQNYVVLHTLYRSVIHLSFSVKNLRLQTTSRLDLLHYYDSPYSVKTQVWLF